MSRVTIKDVQVSYPHYTKYEQVGGKQLFICSDYTGQDTANNHNKILVSYSTIVGFYNAAQCTWILTKERYSATTTRQLNYFAKGRNVTWVDSLTT